MSTGSERTPLLLFVVGAAASIILLLLYAYAPDLRDAVSNEADVTSRSAIGFAGLKQLLDRSGIATQIDRGVTARETQPSLSILTPSTATSDADWKEHDEHGPVLIILPKWITVAMPLHPAWVMKTGAWPAFQITKMLRPIAHTDLVQASGDFHGLVPTVDPRPAGTPAQLSGDIQELQYFPKRDRAEMFLNDPRSSRLEKGGVAIVIQVRTGKNPIYVLSDPDIMNNHGLSDPGKAQLALAIIRDLREGNGPVRVDVTLDGMTRTPSLLKSLFEPPFRGATLCALLAAILMALHALARFGAPLHQQRLAVRGKLALAANTAELVRMMAREPAMAPRYVRVMRNLALARLGARARGAAEQDRMLETMEAAAGSELHYRTLADDAARAMTSADFTQVATRAWTWKETLTREHHRN